MAMLLTCSNRGCGHSDYHRLDESTNEVICTKCAQPVNVSTYAKTALRSMKQVVKKVKSDFEVTCPDCGAIDAPALKKFGKHTTKVICKQCGAINAHLSRYFVEALKLRPGIEVHQATPEEMAEAGLGQPTRFNRAQTPQLQVSPTEAVVVSPPEDVVPEPEKVEPVDIPVDVEPTTEPVKVEYYPWGEEPQPEKETKVATQSGVVVVAPTGDEPINVDKKAAAAPKRVPVRTPPKNVLPKEDALRQRIEKMPAQVTTHVQPPPPGLNLSDFARTGVVDYAGDVED